MIITKEKLEEIKKYIDDNYCNLLDEDEDIGDVCLGVQDYSHVKGAPSIDDFDDYFDDLKNKVDDLITDTWQESLFSIIDNKLLDEVEVYKRAGITKQVFSNIRKDSDYHPNKDTAISLCIGLKLNLDEAQDLLKKQDIHCLVV